MTPQQQELHKLRADALARKEADEARQLVDLGDDECVLAVP